MPKFIVPKPISGGLILSYKCNGECKHCMYFGSPKWNDKWIDEDYMIIYLTELSKFIKKSPYGQDRVSLNNGLHFTGGEPFLNYGLLLKGVKIANELNIPSLFVETNCYWCKNDEITRRKLLDLKKEGLRGILISVNPFILEFVPFERTLRAIKISQEIFGNNTMIYQLYYFYQFIELNIKETLPIENYLRLVSIEDLKRKVELIKMGRAAYKLQNLYKKYPIEVFLNENCKAELVRNWHCHFDNYGNYVCGYCGGISWGKVANLDSLCNEGIILDQYPILNALISGSLKDLYNSALDKCDYSALPEGYISKCHLCFDIRKELVIKTNEYNELRPKEFYMHIGF